MKILLTNDDGVRAEGIYVLAQELERENYEVIIVAPHMENSAKSQSINILEPIRVEKIELEGLKAEVYSVESTPADCVRIAFDQILDGNVDMILSGINRGLNVGKDTLYSGTASAAIEGNLHGIPALAVSAELVGDECDFKMAAEEAIKIVKQIEDYKKEGKKSVKENILLNLNTPYREDGKALGIKVCELGGVIHDCYEMIEEKSNFKTYKIVGRAKTELEKGKDRYYIDKGYITITPLQYNYTDFGILEEVNDWLK